MFLKIKQFCCHVMIRNGQILLNILRQTLTEFGLKKLISTSYIHSVGSKQLSLNQIGLRVISRIVTL